MTVLADQTATLTQDAFTKLAPVGFGRVRVTITGQSGENATIRFRVKRGFARPVEFDALVAEVAALNIFGFGDISAKPPQGVATLDIIYEVRTKGDF
jgi:hypothetical protein